MADSRVKYSEAMQTAPALTLNDNDILTTAQEDAQSETGYVSKAFRLSTLANKIANGIDYSTELQTNSKKILGAINELKAQTGVFDITSEAEGPTATFNDGGDNIPVKNCTVQINAVQAGSGTPSPTNVRPITARTSVTVSVRNKNLINPSNWVTGKYISVDGTIKTEQYSQYCFVHIEKGETYTLSGNTTDGGGVRRLHIFDENLNWIEQLDYANVTTNSSYTLSGTTTQPSGYLGISVNTHDENIQVEKNTSATTYITPQGEDKTISLGQNVYGAELNITTGEGKEKKKYQEFDGTESWNRATNGAFYTRAFVDTTWLTKKISNMYPYGGEVGSSADVTEDKTFYAQFSETSQSYCRLWIKDTDYTTVTDFTNFLSNNHLQIVYGLKTPIALTTTPETGITTLAGENNIYADTGDVDVEYFNEQADDIAALFRLMTPAT